MLKLNLKELINITSMIFDSVDIFEKCESMKVNPEISEIIIHDKDFKGDRKIDIGLLAK